MIRIEKTTANKLKQLKTIPEETYNTTINKLIEAKKCNKD